MSPLDFLAAVLPSSGIYCAAEFQSRKKEHAFVTTIPELHSAAMRMNEAGHNAYFALATFAERGNRTADNARLVKALWVDLDVGKAKDNTSYPSKETAAEAFNAFMQRTGMQGLGQPIVASSGFGYHIYWPLDEEVPIASWKPVAENFKLLCQQEGLIIDMTCTADAARVMRMPGTTNFGKDGTQKKAEVILDNSGVFSLMALDTFIRGKLKVKTFEEKKPPTEIAGLPGTRPKASSSSVKLMENSETLFKEIVNKTEAGVGCGQLAYYIENASGDGLEPLWRGMLSIAQKCSDGEKAVVWLSELHPYDSARMAQKLREIKGPYPCLKLDSENPGVCTSCSHFGKITNPLALGRKVALETAPKEVEISSPPTASSPAKNTITRPTPPRGFAYGKTGAIFRETKTTDAEGNEMVGQSMVLPYSLFVVSILQHEGEHIVHMLAMRPEGAAEITLPQRAVVSKDDTVKNLAEQNIIAAYGQGNDKYLFDYVRGCVEEASVAAGAVRVPTNYGWQADDTFVFNERIYSAGVSPQHVPMRHLANINKSTCPTGSLANWQRLVNMLKMKKLHDVLAMSLVGFGAPLMRFTGYDGITVHLGSSESGTGKSLALELSSSIWGHPVRYRVGKSTSDVAMQQRLGMLNSLPLVSDEITAKNRKDFEWFPAFIFDMSEGQGKERMESGANRERENTTYWKSIALMSSNTHVMDYLTGGRKHSSEGEIRRVLELNMATKIVWEEKELEAVALLKDNYAVAGDVYVQYLVDNIVSVRDVVREVRAQLKAAFSFRDDERFWLAGCTAMVAGGVLAARAGISDFPMESLIAVLQGMVESSRKLVKDSTRTAEDVLNAYIRESYGKFVVVKVVDGTLAAALGNNGIIDESLTRSEILGRVEHNVTVGFVDFYIEEQLLKKYCSSMSFGYSDFRKQMEASCAVSYQKKDLLAKTKGPQMRVNAIKISRRITDEEADDKLSVAAH